MDVGAHFRHTRELTFTVRVHSSNSEPNSVIRKITVVAPPKLETSLEGPLGLGVKFERWDRCRSGSLPGFATVEAPTLIGSKRNLAAPS